MVPGGEMCMEGGRTGTAGRRGAKKQAAAEHKANRQPQRGLGVAQLEKIRLHNQMMAAYRSAGAGGILHPAADTAAQPFAAAGASSFQQPYLTDGAGYRSSSHTTFIPNCFEETERGIVPAVQVQHYYDDGHHHHLPSLFAHDVRDSSGHRLGQPPPTQPQQQQPYCLMSSSSAEELDLELRL